MPTFTDNAFALLDVARDMAFETLDTARADDGDEASAVRILLLAAAQLASPIELAGQALPVSSALRHALDETLAAYADPISATTALIPAFLESTSAAISGHCKIGRWC